MHFASLFVFATAITALPSLVRRDAAETLANLQSIDTSTKSLTSTITSWDGSLLGALGIQSAANAVGVRDHPRGSAHRIPTSYRHED